MKAAERGARDALIARLHQQRMPQVEIARKVGLEPPRVYRILRGLGLTEPKTKAPGRPEGAASSVWDRDPDNRLRMAIWRRQHQAAQQRLAEIRETQDG